MFSADSNKINLLLPLDEIDEVPPFALKVSLQIFFKNGQHLV
jgi:hypothetical protein